MQIVLQWRRSLTEFLEVIERDHAHLSVLERNRPTAMLAAGDAVESHDIAHDVVSRNLFAPILTLYGQLARPGANRVQRSKAVAAVEYRFPLLETTSNGNQRLQVAHRIGSKSDWQA
jgi:PHD/YefM family antitoxin component YafN of YafNO toxin-antitoxin module